MDVPLRTIGVGVVTVCLCGSAGTGAASPPGVDRAAVAGDSPASAGDSLTISPAGVVVSAVYFDGYADGDADEAVQLWNVSAAARDLAGWSLTDGEGRAAFPARAPVRLEPGRSVWLAADGAAFRTSFGRGPDWSWAADGATAGRMATIGGGPKLANAGDDLVLADARGEPVDAIVYGNGPAPSGWIGPALWPYHTAQIAAAHQVLYRKIDARTGQPIMSMAIGSGQFASAWASDGADPRLGRRVRRPGWSLDERRQPAVMHESAMAELAIAPDGLFAFLRRHLAAATRSIEAEVYTFENPDLADVIVERARAGVAVRLLVDGAPAGGVDPNQRWVTARLAGAGASIAYMADGGPIGERYRNMHAKLFVVDGRDVLIGTENPSLASAPSDDLADGTSGRRGMYLSLTSPAAAEWATALLADDMDAARFHDLRPYQDRDPVRGAPAPGFEPLRGGGGAGYEPRHADSISDSHVPAMTFQTAPENALDDGNGLLGLVARAGPGDSVRVMQLDEPRWWGAGPAEGPLAQNPRWTAYVNAARRGARVRVLLDSYFDDAARPNSNFDSAKALNILARAEGLDLEARTGNPTGQGIHAKLVLVGLQGQARFGAGEAEYWLHVGSLNGSEVSNKLNREVAVGLRSEPLWRRLETVFEADWAASTPHVLFLPANVD